MDYIHTVKYITIHYPMTKFDDTTSFPRSLHTMNMGHAITTAYHIELHCVVVYSK